MTETTTTAAREATMSANKKLTAALTAADGPMTQAELAAAAGVGRSTATTWLGQQVAKGQVARHILGDTPCWVPEGGSPAALRAAPQ